MKILVVERSKTIQRLVEIAIIESQNTYVLAETGYDALQIYKHTPPQLVIMNIELDDMTGFELTQNLREQDQQALQANRHKPWVPIIFISSNFSDEYVTKAILSGADDYLAKPITKSILKAKINALGRIANMQNQLIKKTEQLENSNQILENLSIYDQLTQIHNRRGLEEQGQKELLLSLRHETDLSICMLDIDHFKKYIQFHGQAQGDDCIKKIAKCLQRSIRRPTDYIARYNGEKFTVLLPETNATGALTVATDLQKEVRELNIKSAPGTPLEYITLSIGLFTATNKQDKDLNHMVTMADEQLYKAKQQGQEHIVQYQP